MRVGWAVAVTQFPQFFEWKISTKCKAIMGIRVPEFHLKSKDTYMVFWTQPTNWK